MRIAYSYGLSLLALLTLSPPAYGAGGDRPFFRASSIAIVIGASANETDGGVVPIASDFVFLNGPSGTQAADIIAANGYAMNSSSGWVAGHDFSAGLTRLELLDETSGGNFSNGDNSSYLDNNDSFTAFGIDGDTDVTTRKHRKLSRFLVVSNAPFDVYARASNLIKTDDFAALDYENIGIKIRLNTSGGSGPGSWGSRAQNPKIGGTGFDLSINDLSDISAGPTKVFDGGRRTAKNRGSLLEQAVSFNIRYALSPDADSSASNAYDFSMGVGTIGADVTYTVYTP